MANNQTYFSKLHSTWLLNIPVISYPYYFNNSILYKLCTTLLSAFSLHAHPAPFHYAISLFNHQPIQSTKIHPSSNTLMKVLNLFTPMPNSNFILNPFLTTYTGHPTHSIDGFLPHLSYLHSHIHSKPNATLPISSTLPNRIPLPFLSILVFNKQTHYTPIRILHTIYTHSPLRKEHIVIPRINDFHDSLQTLGIVYPILHTIPSQSHVMRITTTRRYWTFSHIAIDIARYIDSKGQKYPKRDSMNVHGLICDSGHSGLFILSSWAGGRTLKEQTMNAIHCLISDIT